MHVDRSPHRAAQRARRRPGLAAVYAAAAAIALVPDVLILAQLTTLEIDRLALLVLGLFFNPFTFVPTLLALWFAGIARRLAAGRGGAEAQAVFVERGAAVVGAGLCMLCWLGVRAAEASAARGGGLLSGFAYLPLVAAAYLFALAIASWTVRRGGAALTGAPRARDPGPAGPDDPRS